MKAIKPPTNDQPPALSPETRLTLNAPFSPEMFVLQPTATSIEDCLQLAESYAKDVDRLSAEVAMYRARNEQLEAYIRKIYADRESLRAGLSAKQRTDEAVPASALAAPSLFPVAGEVRFYKKRYSAPSHDILVRVCDCGCNRWQGGHAGHKAQEGIAKLEGNRTDWKTIHHCASCTGGGMWRVRW